VKRELEKAQCVAQCEVSATRVVVDAALLHGGKSRRGGHRIANISRNCGRISPMDSACFLAHYMPINLVEID